LPTGEGPYLVVDLGGGSTELVVGAAGAAEPAAVVSLNLGCVRVTERFLFSDPPTVEELEAARAFVRAEVRAALDSFPALGSGKAMVGVAGTVSTLVQLVLGVEHYERELLHHQLITRAEVEALLRELDREALVVRRGRPAIEAGRADVIVAGALILAEVMASLGYEEARYSESDILDGIVAELLRSRAR
jgi:exopolyphosphatase/guanosine-5'-triphosphate,3'-diphosphate pyrophosphatase